MTIATEELLTSEQVAEKLKCSTKCILRLTKDGRLPAVTVPYTVGWRYKSSVVQAFIDALEGAK